jgi:hypothetical protein
VKPVVFTADHLHSGRTVSRGDAVVHQRLALPVRVPLVHINGAALGIEHRRDAVHRAIPVVQVVFAVRMDFDQPRRDDETAGVDGLDALQRLLADRLDSVADDADMGGAIEATLGIHDVAIRDDQVVGPRGASWCQQQ